MNEREQEQHRVEELDRLLGLEPRAVSASRAGSALRRSHALDSDRKAAAWRAVAARLDAEPATSPESDARFHPPGSGPANSFFVRPLLGAAAVLLLVVGGLWYFRGEAGIVPGVELPGKVVFVQGRVTRAGSPLQKGDLLHPGDEVVTGPAARLDFVVDEKNAFRLMPSGRMRYEMRTGAGRIEVSAGYLAAVVRRRDRMGRLDLVTGPVLSRVTGTTLFVGSPQANTGYVCICHGSIEIHDAVAGAPTATPRVHRASHHYAGIFVREGQGPVQELPGDMRFHDDRMLEDLARLIDERIDWNAL